MIVDPTNSDFAGFNSIQDAIDAVGANPSERWTVLIYAGVYEEELTLDDDHDNVDLVGVDPDAVIIKPPLGDNGVVISGFGARNNSIRNLTIQIRDSTPAPSDLDGILITKPGSGTDPSGITIDNVKVRLEADGSRAVRAAVPVSSVVITDATIECIANAGSGIVFEDTATAVAIADSTIRTTGDDAPAINFAGGVVGKSPASVLLHNIMITASSAAVRVHGSASLVAIRHSTHITPSAVGDLTILAGE
jgi:pectin methylesterase-like acyl-CoA thioesterase